MNVINILIVEDNRATSFEISESLKDLGYHTIGIAESAKKALEYIRVQQPDVVLMDIDIEGSLDGIDLATRIQQEWEIPVVYLSDKSDEVTVDRASVLSHCIYLSKPITNYKILDNNLRKVLVNNSSQNIHPPIEEEYFLDFLMVTTSNTTKERIDYKDILYVKADNQYSTIYLKNGTFHKVSKNLTRVVNLINFKELFRVHRSYVINVNAIEKLEDNEIKLLNNDEIIPTSAKHLKELKQLIPIL